RYCTKGSFATAAIMMICASPCPDAVSALTRLARHLEGENGRERKKEADRSASFNRCRCGRLFDGVSDDGRIGTFRFCGDRRIVRRYGRQQGGNRLFIGFDIERGAVADKRCRL